MARGTQQGKPLLNTAVLAILFGALAGGITAFVVLEYNMAKSTDTLIKEWYLTENAVHVSPHHIRKAMAKGDESFLLIDLRSAEEYKEGHIRGAVSIPAYKDRDHSDYGAQDRIISAFRKLPKGKDIIIYCYSTPCMTGRKIGKMLAENGIYVKHLGIGWNEWRYFWTVWNHPHEWNSTHVEDYLWNGTDPGPMTATAIGEGCPIEGEFGC